MLTGKSTIRTGEGTIRAGQGFNVVEWIPSLDFKNHKWRTHVIKF